MKNPSLENKKDQRDLQVRNFYMFDSLKILRNKCWIWKKYLNDSALLKRFLSIRVFLKQLIRQLIDKLHLLVDCFIYGSFWRKFSICPGTDARFWANMSWKILHFLKIDCSMELISAPLQGETAARCCQFSNETVWEARGGCRGRSLGDVEKAEGGNC